MSPSKKKIICIIQARMGSNRLPGKAIKKISGVPCIDWVIQRASLSENIDEIWLASTKKKEDKIFKKVAKRFKINLFRGSTNNVLSRFYEIAMLSSGTHFVRITADCPLIDHRIIDKAIKICVNKNFDYVSNTLDRTFPDGLDVEVFSKKALVKTYKKANHPFLKEHVTPYIHGQGPKILPKGNFKKFSIKNKSNYSNLRWTLDESTDLKFLNFLCKFINYDTDWNKIRLIINKNPTLLNINNKIKTNEGSKLSLEKYSNHMKSDNFRNSKKLFKRALHTIPMASQTFSKSFLQWPVNISPLFLEKGKGCIITDVDNNKYIDYLLALMPIITGYADSDIDKIVKKQMNNGIILSLSHPLEIELSELLTSIIPYAEMVKFGKNGSDALSAAVRVARAYTNRDLIAVSGYHGWHDWFIGTTSRNLGIPKKVRSLTKKFEFNNIESFKKTIGSNAKSFAAIVIEPDSIVEANKSFLKYIRNFCNKHNILLVFDEVICGFRTAWGGAANKYAVIPDLGCFGKSMANGYPISALVGKRKYMKIFEDIFVSGTFAGDILSIAASIATIKKIKKNNVIKELNKLGEKLKIELNSILENYNMFDDIKFEGNNWWPRLNVKTNRMNTNLFQTLFRQELIANGLFLGASLNLCLAHCDKTIFNSTLNRFKKTAISMKKIKDSSNPEVFLKGEKVSAVFKVR